MNKGIDPNHSETFIISWSLKLLQISTTFDFIQCLQSVDQMQVVGWLVVGIRHMIFIVSLMPVVNFEYIIL